MKNGNARHVCFRRSLRTRDRQKGHHRSTATLLDRTDANARRFLRGLSREVIDGVRYLSDGHRECATDRCDRRSDSVAGSFLGSV